MLASVVDDDVEVVAALVVSPLELIVDAVVEPSLVDAQSSLVDAIEVAVEVEVDVASSVCPVGLKHAAADAAASSTIRRRLGTTVGNMLGEVRATRTFESPPSAKITAALIDLRRRLDAIELREPQPTPELDREPAPEPAPAPARPARAGRELRIAGGVAVGVGVGAGVLAAAMAARGQRLEREFDDPQANCRLDELVGECAQIYERGQRADMLAITGLSAGALFLSGGLALLLLGRRQAAAARSAFTPLVAPGLTGIGLRGAF